MGRIVTADEVKANSTTDCFYLVLHGKVYDVAKFLDEHPGGDDVIKAEAGQDATEAFEDVGHSDEARALLPGFYVGDLEPNTDLKHGGRTAPKGGLSGAIEQGSNLMYFVPLGLLGAYFGWRYYATGSA